MRTLICLKEIVIDNVGATAYQISLLCLRRLSFVVDPFAWRPGHEGGVPDWDDLQLEDNPRPIMAFMEEGHAVPVDLSLRPIRARFLAHGQVNHIRGALRGSGLAFILKLGRCMWRLIRGDDGEVYITSTSCLRFFLLAMWSEQSDPTHTYSPVPAQASGCQSGCQQHCFCIIRTTTAGRRARPCAAAVTPCSRPFFPTKTRPFAKSSIITRSRQRSTARPPQPGARWRTCRLATACENTRNVSALWRWRLSRTTALGSNLYPSLLGFLHGRNWVIVRCSMALANASVLYAHAVSGGNRAERLQGKGAPRWCAPSAGGYRPGRRGGRRRARHRGGHSQRTPRPHINLSERPWATTKARKRKCPAS